MAIIQQINLFDYSEIENLGDLERFYFPCDRFKTTGFSR
jgi:hypothetical protein